MTEEKGEARCSQTTSLHNNAEHIAQRAKEAKVSLLFVPPKYIFVVVPCGTKRRRGS